MGELAAGDVGIAAVLAQTSTLAHALFDGAMTAEQRARYLPAFVADDGFHLAYAADAHAPDTEWCYHRNAAAPAPTLTARREAGGDWRLDGTLEQVANAPQARVFAIGVTAQGAAHTLLVPRDARGLTVREPADRPQWYHGTRGALVFDNCRVPAADVLAHHCSDQTPAAVLQRCALNLGVARAAYDTALAHAQFKVQGARRIIEHEGVGILLAEMLVRLEAARNQLWQTAWVVDHPQAVGDRSVPDLPLVELTGVFVAEAAHEVTLRAAEVFGAMGILRDMPLFQYVHDAQVFLHAGRGVTAAKLGIAERIDGYRRPAVAAAA
jgi:alkylation response protein AidB-like acyl-CoA dehydrogenase